MSITDELRDWAHGFTEPYKRNEQQLLAIADRIEAAALSRRNAAYNMGYKAGIDMGFASADDWLADHEDAMAEHGWVKLPVDADGVPIRMGDVLTDGEYKFKVFELAAFGDGSWSIRNEDGDAWAACDVTHHHEPTVEDVLWEFASAYDRIGGEDDEHQKYLNLIAEFAAKLRLAGDAE